jgi:L-alanine-DL-glutamate epimerase-like enolase superfamily enzyme
MPYFEMITVRIRTGDGIEGLGYTYTVGQGGIAVYALLKHELPKLLVDEDPI